jgi:arylsulfatase A-like enzyme
MRHLYARSVRLLDDWLSRVLTALDEDGALDDTLVLLTSDHGENFGEGGLLAHAFSIDDRLIRVPFVANRSDFAAPEGPRSLVDLPALLADYLDIEDHPWTDSPIQAGLAAAQFDFAAPDDPRLERVVEDWHLDEAGRAKLVDALTCVTDGRHKLQRRGQVEELFDLEADPLELHPMAPDTYPPAADTLRTALSNEALWVRGETDPVHAADDDAADIENRMKLLGYM